MTAQAWMLIGLCTLSAACSGGGSGGTSGSTSGTASSGGTGGSGGTTGTSSSSGTTGSPMGTGSLQGPGAFSPNAVLALVPIFSDGGINLTNVTIVLISSTPPFSCEILDAGFPDSGMIEGLAAISIQTVGGKPLTTGTMPMGGNTSDYDDAGEYGFLTMSGPTSPPSDYVQIIGGSLSGSLTVTEVGSEWAGTFSTSVFNLADGGQLQISGSFDTSVVCQMAE